MAVRFLDSDEIVTKVPRKEVSGLIESRLSATEFNSIVDALDVQISGKEIHTSSWMPGNDWTGSPYQVLHEKAARFNEELSGKMFGLMVFIAFMQRPEVWITGRFEKDGEPITGRTYFLPGS
jgi:hypothetical protein